MFLVFHARAHVRVCQRARAYACVWILTWHYIAYSEKSLLSLRSTRNFRKASFKTLTHVHTWRQEEVIIPRLSIFL